MLINKKKRPCDLVNFVVPADHRMKMKESKKIGKYFDLARELKKLWNMKATVRSERETGGTRDQRKNRGNPDHINVQISSNSSKSPGDLRKLAVTQTSGKNLRFKISVKN